MLLVKKKSLNDDYEMMRRRAENTNTTINDTVSYFDYRFNFPANSMRDYNIVNRNINTLGTPNEDKNIIGAQ